MESKQDLIIKFYYVNNLYYTEKDKITNEKYEENIYSSK